MELNVEAPSLLVLAQIGGSHVKSHDFGEYRARVPDARVDRLCLGDLCLGDLCLGAADTPSLLRLPDLEALHDVASLRCSPSVTCREPRLDDAPKADGED